MAATFLSQLWDIDSIHQIHSRKQAYQNERNGREYRVSQLTKIASVTWRSGVVATSLTSKVFGQLFFEWLSIPHYQCESRESKHRREDIVAQSDQYLALRCTKLEWVLGLLCPKQSMSLLERFINSIIKLAPM